MKLCPTDQYGYFTWPDLIIANSENVILKAPRFGDPAATYINTKTEALNNKRPPTGLHFPCQRVIKCASIAFCLFVTLSPINLVMSTAQLGAVKLSSWANILASQSGKSAPGYNQFGSQISRLWAAEPSKYSCMCLCWSCSLLSHCLLVLRCLKSLLLIQCGLSNFILSQLTVLLYLGSNLVLTTVPWALNPSPCKWFRGHWNGQGVETGPGYRR